MNIEEQLLSLLQIDPATNTITVSFKHKYLCQNMVILTEKSEKK